MSQPFRFPVYETSPQDRKVFNSAEQPLAYFLGAPRGPDGLR